MFADGTYIRKNVSDCMIARSLVRIPQPMSMCFPDWRGRKNIKYQSKILLFFYLVCFFDLFFIIKKYTFWMKSDRISDEAKCKWMKWMTGKNARWLFGIISFYTSLVRFPMRWITTEQQPVRCYNFYHDQIWNIFMQHI